MILTCPERTPVLAFRPFFAGKKAFLVVTLLFALILSACVARGQSSAKDSLRAVLQATPPDTSRVKALNDLAFSIILEVFQGFSSSDSLTTALATTEEARSLASQLQYEKGSITAIKNEGLINYLMDQPDRALELYREGVALAEATENYEEQGRILVNMGRLAEDVYYDDSLALRYYREAGDIASTIDNTELQALTNRNIGVVLSRNAVQESLPYYRQALENYRELDDLSSVATMYYNLGSSYFKLGRFQEAEENLLQSLQSAATVNFSDTCRVLNELGVVAKSKGQYTQALDYYNRCISCARLHGDQRRLSLALSNIGEFYNDFGQNEEALEHFLSGLEIDKEIGNQDDIIWDYTTIGKTYQQLGDSSKALEFLEKAVRLGEESNSNELLLAYGNMGDFFEAEEIYAQALIYREKQLRKSLNMDEPVERGLAYVNYGRTLFAIGRDEEALNSLLQGVEVLESVGDQNNLKDAYRWVSDVYHRLGRYEAAYSFLKQAESVNDSLVSKNLTTQLNQLRADRDFAKQRAEIARLEAENAGQQLAISEQRRLRNTFLGSSVLLVLLLGGLYLWYRYRQQKAELTFQKERSEKLKRLDQLKDQFLANTSHELRTPLQGIIGLSESMYDRAADSQQRENLSMVISSGKRLSSLVDDILDFSKLKNSDIHLHKKPVSLHAMADIVLKNLQPLAQGKNLRLINNIPAGLPAAHADENRLQQVLFNLIGNGIKFTEEGLVRLNGTLQDQDTLRIEVTDTGIGIPVDQQATIFEAFEQADASSTREFSGTGLGLSISRSLVQLQGGEMWVESAPGKGASFFFTLPVSKEAAASTPLPATHSSGAETVIQKSGLEVEAEQQGTPPATARRSFHILTVDDEPVNQQVLRNHLSDAGYSVTQALNGEQALNALEEKGPFHLVLLDLMMPRMSGYEVCEQIRRRFLPSELPVIMITAKDQIQDIVQGLSLGANDYLTKPFSKEELLARIRTQLDLHHIFEAAGRFVPNEFLHSLGHHRITEVSLGDQALREVTVFFSDIRDYTGLAETMTPRENFRFVNALSGRLGPIIQRHHGFVNQYLGDALMAIFTEGPSDALAAAVQMQQVLRGYNEQRIAKNRRPIRIGIGMHTGPLIMGIIGDDRRLDAATISDTVNTTSRIENLTKFFGAEILLSEDSLALLRQPHSFHFRYLGKVQVKGRKAPVGIYECLEGDPPPLTEKKIRHLATFENALKSYLDRNFAEAATLFGSITDDCPEDTVARLFREKAAKNITADLSEDWSGIEKMDMK